MRGFSPPPLRLRALSPPGSSSADAGQRGLTGEQGSISTCESNEEVTQQTGRAAGTGRDQQGPAGTGPLPFFKG